MRKKGFTGIEVLIVIIIVAILVALLLPALAAAKRHAEKQEALKGAISCCESWSKDDGCKAGNRCRWCGHPCHWSDCEGVNINTNTKCICKRQMRPVEMK